jgi:hypothetical protein
MSNDSKYKKISTKETISFSPEKEIIEKHNKKRKFSNVDQQDANQSANQNMYQNINQDVWNDYRYTQSDIEKMNSLIDQYKNKKRKSEKGKDENRGLGWVSATQTKYYLMNDQSLDWLTLYYQDYGIDSKAGEPSTSSNTSVNLISNSTSDRIDLIKEASQIEILLEGGNIFELKIFEELKNVYGDRFVKVFDEATMKIYHDQKEKDIEGFIRDGNNRVKDLMNQGIPIIAQAPLINDNNKTFGVADLLVRSDYLATLFEKFTNDNEINIKASFLKMKKDEEYHYRVIDCKWTTMTLCVDEVTIRNDGLFPAYKGQLAVYTAALESLQGYIPNYAYIMSKAWKIGKSNILPEEECLYRGYSAFDRPGIINYKNKDNNYLKLTKEAVQWMQKVSTEGREWRYYPDKPSVLELYPNMNKSINPAFDKIKEKLAKRYGDPTMVWYVSPQNRKSAHENGVYDVRDPKCNIHILGITQNKNTINRGSVIEKIININKYNQITDLVLPKKIKDNTNNWQTEDLLEYYVDFETINYNIYNNPHDMNIDNSYFGSDVTFMIGFGFKHDNNISTDQLFEKLKLDKTKCNYYKKIVSNWEFVCLHLPFFQLKNKMEMFRIFYQFILARQGLICTRYNLNGFNITSKMFHWADAEIRFMNKANERMKSGNDFSELNLKSLINKFNERTTWIDMYKIFEKEPIVVKGAFRFKLKHIGNALHSHNLISTKWEDGKMSDGFSAMVEAIKLYRNNIQMGINDSSFMEIIKYNETDCRVLSDIVNYLRINNC